MHGRAWGVKYTVDGGDKEQVLRLGVTRFSVMKDSLRLNYRVTNVSSRDLWVCTSMEYYEPADSQYTIETRIVGETLRIKRRGNVEQNMFVQTGGGCAGYYRLRPGRSRSGTVVVALPAENRSVVYKIEEPLPPKHAVVLKRVVLELGYFDENLATLFAREEGRWYGHTVSRGGQRNPNVVVIRYVSPHRWRGLDLEEAVQVTFSDVDIPGMVGQPWQSPSE